MIERLFKNTAGRLAITIVIGVALWDGGALEVILQELLIHKQITSQIIFFMVSLIVIGSFVQKKFAIDLCLDLLKHCHFFYKKAI